MCGLIKFWKQKDILFDLPHQQTVIVYYKKCFSNIAKTIYKGQITITIKKSTYSSLLLLFKQIQVV
jgi:hypothetical protein